MRIGWRTFLKHKFQSKSPYNAVGIAVSLDTVTFCALKTDGNNTFTVEHEETVSFSTWAQQLSRWVKEHGLTGTPCYTAFSLHWYQILQVDRPKVEAEEVSAALSWSIRELTGTEQEIIFDYVDLPVPLAGAAKLNVISIPKNDVKMLCENVFSSGLSLKAISVEELATCELITHSSDAVLTLVQEAGEEICLNIVKDGQLYVARRLKGFENLGSFSEDELNMGVAESLSVQVQRSMDYFESQLRQPPVKQILMRLDTQHPNVLKEQINQVVAASVTELIPANVESKVDLPLHRVNYTSLGAALSGRHPEDFSQAQTS